MARNLPPLIALRAFEAAARLLSFTRAGEELHVTQSAISHQVNRLETDLGMILFERRHRSLKLTREGQTLLPIVSDALDRIETGVESLSRGELVTEVGISLTYPIGVKWLSARLPRFLKMHSNIDIHVHYATQLVDFAEENIDIALRWGTGRWPNLDSVRLFSSELVCVGSPEFAARLRTENRTFPDLPLLHQDNFRDWEDWFGSVGLDPSAARTGPVVDDSLTLIQAALTGEGAILARAPLVLEELQSGVLVRLSPHTTQKDKAYYLVTRRDRQLAPFVHDLCNFIRSEAHDTDLALSGTSEAL